MQKTYEPTFERAPAKHGPLEDRRAPKSLSDRVAFGLTKLLRFFADTFFAKRYGHRAVVLETVAAVPGMVAGMLIHLKSLRRMEDDHGWVKTLLEEADNERMHLMTFIAVAKPNWLERAIVLLAQGVFFNAFFVLYLFFPRTAHRMVAYFEEEAVVSYTAYLEDIDAGRTDNVAAPQIAIDYWGLKPDARLRDVVIVVREDEAGHRDVNHEFADILDKGGPDAVDDDDRMDPPSSSVDDDAAKPSVETSEAAPAKQAA